MSRETMNDGGPAFPFHIDKRAINVEDFGGMSVRDYFAGQIAAGIAANHSEVVAASHIDIIARASYKLADALLKARGDTPTEPA